MIEFDDLESAIQALKLIQDDTADKITEDDNENWDCSWKGELVSITMGADENKDEMELYQLLLNKKTASGNKTVTGLMLDCILNRNLEALRSYILSSEITHFSLIQASDPDSIQKLSIVVKSSHISTVTLLISKDLEKDSCIKVLLEENPQITSISVNLPEHLLPNSDSQFLLPIMKNPLFKSIEFRFSKISLENLQYCMQLMYQHPTLIINFDNNIEEGSLRDQLELCRAISLSKMAFSFDTIIRLRDKTIRCYFEKMGDYTLNKTSLLLNMVKEFISIDLLVKHCKAKLYEYESEWFKITCNYKLDKFGPLLNKALTIFPETLTHCVMNAIFSWENKKMIGAHIVMHHLRRAHPILNQNVVTIIRSFLLPNTKVINDIPSCENHSSDLTWIDRFLAISAPRVGAKEIMDATLRYSMQEHRRNLGWMNEMNRGQVLNFERSFNERKSKSGSEIGVRS